METGNCSRVANAPMSTSEGREEGMLPVMRTLLLH